MQSEIVIVALASKRPHKKSLGRKGNLTRFSKSSSATGRIKPRKKTPEAKLKKALWELCKTLIRAKYGNTCYTCGKTGLAGSTWQTGHFIPASICGAYLRWDLRNLRPQCYRCNIDLSGNGAVFYRKLVLEEGQEYVDQLFKDKDMDIKASRTFLQGLIDDYSAFAAKLEV
jgi:hypothetical protein